MNEQPTFFEKNVSADESDPAAVAEHAKDEPGSFLSLYRSLSANYLTTDEFFVRGSVDEGIVPESVRYAIMRRGQIEAYRGVVKSTRGELFYFNWHPDAYFTLVKADNDTKKFEANKLLKACNIGCDLKKGGAPLDPGETITDATLSGTEHDPDEEEKKAVPVPSAGAKPVAEDQYIESQQRLATDDHPGSTQAQMPGQDGSGSNWHPEETITRAQDAMAPLGANDGQKHWNKADIVKALGRHLQATAPRVAPAPNALEHQYMIEALGATPEEIRKGINLAPRHRRDFTEWQANRLRNHLNGLTHWLGRNE